MFILRQVEASAGKDAVQLAAQRLALVNAGRRHAAAGLVTGTGGNLAVWVGDLVEVTPTGGGIGNLFAQIGAA
jgi:hypothetical protein